MKRNLKHLAAVFVGVIIGTAIARAVQPVEAAPAWTVRR